jgi:lipid II:glycine glycyltransferase (peptidoglycan interpeptide bridge formation enzyme)
LGHKLNLSGQTEALFDSFASSVRRAIRKAERSGLQVFVARTREAVTDFYRLHCRTRKRHGVPPQPLSFFLSIYEEIIERGAGFIVLAKDGPKFVAGAVFFHFGKNAVYKFGASNQDGRETRANNLVMWEGIKTLNHAGCDMLDFGRTSVANEGLRRFKLGWATQEERIGYSKFDCSIGDWVAARDRASGLHQAIFSCLPVCLNRVAGTMLYPHLD